MGSWGYQARQSDGALDTLAPLDRAFERELYALFGLDGAALERADRRERRKAARGRKPRKTLKGRIAHMRRCWRGWTSAGDHRATLRVARDSEEKKTARAQDRALDNRWWRVGALQVALERGVPVPRAVIERALEDIGSILAEDNWAPSRRAARRLQKQLRALYAHPYNMHSSRPSDEVMPWRGWPRAERKRKVRGRRRRATKKKRGA